MAKAGIHPDYHAITVRMSDGTEYQSRSTWGKPGDTMILDVDSLTHPAWVGGVNIRKTGQMEKFSNKFSFLGATPVDKQAEADAKAAAAGEAKKDDKKTA